MTATFQIFKKGVMLAEFKSYDSAKQYLKQLGAYDDPKYTIKIKYGYW